MSKAVTLYGYRYSVCNRFVRLVLHEKDVAYSTVNFDLFTNPDPTYLNLHPFGRVPALTHERFSVFSHQALRRAPCASRTALNWSGVISSDNARSNKAACVSGANPPTGGSLSRLVGKE